MAFNIYEVSVNTFGTKNAKMCTFILILVFKMPKYEIFINIGV